MVPNGSQLSFTYDGFLPLSITWSGEVNGSVSQGFDNNFWVTGRSVNGLPVSYSYDNDGLLTAAGDLGLERSPVNGLLTATTLGSTATSRSYNGFGELAGETAMANGTAVLGTQYERDKLGRITRKVENIEGVSTVLRVRLRPRRPSGDSEGKRCCRLQLHLRRKRQPPRPCR